MKKEFNYLEIEKKKKKALGRFVRGVIEAKAKQTTGKEKKHAHRTIPTRRRQ